MKYILEAASQNYTNKDVIKEYYLDTLKEKFNITYDDTSNKYYIKINTLEELMEFIKITNSFGDNNDGIVLSTTEKIIIYDDYIE